MRIAIFHNLPSGGAKRALYEWTRFLSHSHRIDLYTLSTADHEFCDIRPFVKDQITRDFTPHNLFRSPMGRLNQFQRWRDLRELTNIGRQIAKDIDDQNYDVVFANPCIFTHIPIFLQFVRTPTLYYLHEPFGSKFLRPSNRPYLENTSGKELLDQIDPFIKLYNHRLADLQTRSVRKVIRLLANSRFTQEQIRLGFGVDASVCHLGVEFDTFRPLPEIIKENSVISVGELSPRKGFDFIVQCLGKIPNPVRPRLVLACNVVDSTERKYIEALASQHGVDLKILTNIKGDELAIEYNKAQVCVYTPVLEPFGLVPLEAMSCGIPVVGVREGGVPESIVHEETGLLLKRDRDKFSDAIQLMLSDGDLRDQYGRRGREHVMRCWTWEESYHSLENHLIEIAHPN